MGVWNQDASQLTFQEWRSLLSRALGRAQRFELHCWKDESSWTRLALGYGSLKPAEWEGGVVVEGPVTDLSGEGIEKAAFTAALLEPSVVAQLPVEDQGHACDDPHGEDDELRLF